MNTSNHNPTSLEAQRSQLFGSYRAEWLREQLYELYTEPSYFPELTTNKSCVLIGGRGTGKTTVLRGLSYEGQYALSNSDPSSIKAWPTFGLYHRVNTNHVTAFRGDELSAQQWTKLFAHYVNVLLCDLILDFLAWYETATERDVVLPERKCLLIGKSLHLGEPQTHRELREALDTSRVEFEAYINNVVDAESMKLSLQAAPVNLLCSAILALSEFAGKQFFFLIDEYENFLDYQHEVVNTLIKHAGETYCFKIGVRELGWRRHNTLNENEQLIHPADYGRVNIAEKMQGEAFGNFAYSVCQERIARLSLEGQEVIRDVRELLPSISEADEAVLLGVERHNKSARARLKEAGVSDTSELTELELYFVKFWAEANDLCLADVFRNVKERNASWKDRLGNYKHSLLFTIRRKKRGINKYYAGWSVFTQLAAGNIRYLLELVDESLAAQYRQSGSLDMPIPVDIQTKVAQQVGAMNLSELEGVSVRGAQLTKLLLSLGRVFNVMAADAMKHTPEVNQFEISSSQEETEIRCLDEVEEILRSAVMHLALIRIPGSKPEGPTDTREYDFMMHPIFCPLFEFSYRNKRKLTLQPSAILGFIQSPKHTIRAVLREQNRDLDASVPEQLTFFERFYDADTDEANVH